MFGGAGGGVLREFFAYAGSFAGGVTVAAGDVTGDGFADVVTGAGDSRPRPPLVGPRVKEIDGRSPALLAGYKDFAPAFLGGIFVG